MNRRATVVVGLGSEFRRDDGFGLAVVRALRGRLPRSIPLVTVSDTVELVDAWAVARRSIVVDLVLGPRPVPGRLHRWIVGRASGSVGGHTVDVAAALALARVLGTAPRQVVAYGAEGVDVTYGVGLSPALRAAVHPVARAVAADAISGSAPRPGPCAPAGRRVR